MTRAAGIGRAAGAKKSGRRFSSEAFCRIFFGEGLWGRGMGAAGGPKAAQKPREKIFWAGAIKPGPCAFLC